MYIQTRAMIAVMVAIVAFALGGVTASAQTVGVSVWTDSMGGPLTDDGFGITVGPGGSIVVTGSFQGSADFDPGPATRILSSRGSTDAFIAKLADDGSLVWAVSIGGTDTTQANDVAVDSLGDIYVIGSFKGQTDFDPGPADYSITSRGSTDIFLLRLDPNGGYVRAITLGSERSDEGNAVYVDGRRHIYITGNFEELMDVGVDPNGGNIALESVGNDDVFVIRYANDGSLLRAWSMGGSEDAIGRDIAVDSAGNVFVAGDFAGKVDFDPDLDYEKRSAGHEDVFVAKYDDAADMKWADTFGGLEEDERPAISVDSVGAVYVTGNFEATADFDAGPGEYLLPSRGKEDIFLLKLNSYGGTVWAKAIGGLESDRGEDIVAGHNQDFFVTGSFEAAVDFGPGIGQTVLNSAGNKDIFLARYGSGGLLYSAQAMSGPLEDIGHAVALNQTDGVFVTGSYRDTVDFNVGASSQVRSAAGSSDIFVVKRAYENNPFGEVSVYVPVVSVSANTSSAND